MEATEAVAVALRAATIVAFMYFSLRPVGWPVRYLLWLLAVIWLRSMSRLVPGLGEWLSSPGVDLATSAMIAVSLFLIVRMALSQRAMSDRSYVNERRFRALVERGLEGLILANAQGGVLYDSRSAQDVDSSAETDGWKWLWDEVPVEDRDKLVKTFTNCVAGEASAAQPLRVRRRVGEASWQWIEGTFSNHLSDRNVQAVVFSWRDVSDRVVVEHENARNLVLLRTVVDSTPDPICVRDVQGNYLLTNARMQEILAQAGHEAWETVCGTASDGKASCDQAEAAATTRRIREASLEVGTTKHEFNVVETPYRDPDGTLLGTIGFARDVTQERQASWRLRESEERFRQFLEQLPMVVWMSSPDRQRFLYVSSAAQRLIGMQPETMYAHRNEWLHCVHEDDREDVRQWLLKPENDSGEREYRFRHRNGRVGWARHRAIVVRNAQGVVVLRGGTVEDITQAKLAAKRLLQTDAAFERSVLASVWVRQDMTFARVNAAAAKLVGYDESDFTQMLVTDLVFRRSPAVFQQTWRELRQNRTSRLRARLRRKDGSALMAELTAAPLFFEGEELAIISAVDVTDIDRADRAGKRQAQLLERIAIGGDLHEQLVEIAEFVEGLIPGTRVSIMTTDPSGQRLYIAAAPNLPEEYIRAVDGIAIGPAIGSCGTAAWRRERVVVAEISSDPLWEGFRHLACMINAVACWSTPILSRGGKAIGAVAMYHRQPHHPTVAEQNIADIATHLSALAIERNEADESLRASEARWRAMVESTADMVWELDYDGRYTYISPQVRSLLGYAPQEMVGKHVWDFFDSAEAVRGQARYIHDRNLRIAFRNLETARRHRDGHRVFIESSGEPILDAHGEVTGYRGVARNVTDRRKLEERVREQELQLTHVSRLSTVGALSAAIAHEVNQPLYAMQNYALAGLKTMEQLPPASGQEASNLQRVRELLAKLVEQADRAGRIVQRLREFSARRAVTPEAFDLALATRESADLLAAEIRSRQLELEMQLPANLPYVWADRLQIQQVLVNLMRNAFDAVCNQEQNQRILVHAQANDRFVTLEVHDSGVGLSAENAHLLFDAFYTTKKEGLGLGLNISRSIIEAAGGKIWAAASPLGGATLGFTLPVAAKVEDDNEQVNGGIWNGIHRGR